MGSGEARPGVIRFFVGTCARSALADQALENSLNRHCSGPFEIHWMREGEGIFRDWKPIPNEKLPDTAHRSTRPFGNWATPFTMFRLAVPELCEFEGRAIYLDSDMIVLGDPRELWEMEQSAPWKCTSVRRFEPALIDCAGFRPENWPSIAQMKRDSHVVYHQYRSRMRKMGLIDPSLPPDWNCLDGEGLCSQTKLIHFTKLDTQPWTPHPDRINYNYHPSPEAVDLWEEYLHAET